ncbi:metallophosphoesterase [Neisseria wadsworthii 9715]|uniref:Metallophosphoesterase n=2 Tax=Neisseria TaxID=482 RepID=G4CRV2_9NEIS|nr:metallophosphoesterase [Neisseria wadsworthii 9715]
MRQAKHDRLLNLNIKFKKEIFMKLLTDKEMNRIVGGLAPIAWPKDHPIHQKFENGREFFQAWLKFQQTNPYWQPFY